MKVNKVINLIMAIMLVFSIFLASACNSNENIDGNNTGENEKVKQGNVYFTENGMSNYKIVINSNASNEVKYAQEELIYFVQLITDCKIQSISDKFAVFDNNSKYISLGRNDLFKMTNIDLEKENINNSGYMIKSIGNMLFITGDGLYDYGTIFGVYEFLKHTFGLEIYAKDTFKYNEASSNAFMPIFNLTENPDMDRYYFEGASNDYITATRLRMININDFSPWKATGHSQTGILKMSTDYVGKDWLTAQNQICFSAKDMYPVFASNLIRLIEENPDKNRYFIGIEDAVTQCTCTRCLDTKEEYNTNSAGLMMIFFNNVLDIVMEYIETNLNSRQIEFSTYVYEGVYEAPVTKDSSQNYVPHHSDVVPHENLKIMYTPLLINNMFTLDESQNAMNLEALNGWASLSDELEMYGYNYYTRAPSVTSGTFNTFSNYINHLKNAGVTYYYEEGPTLGTNLYNLKLYVQSKMCRDISLSYDELALDFIENYYGPAAEEMQNFYKLFKNYYYNNRSNMPGNCQAAIQSVYNNRFFNEDFLNTQISLLEKANEKIQSLESENTEIYNKYLWRIRAEEFPSRVNRLHIFSSTMGPIKVRSEVDLIRDWTNTLINGNKYHAPGSQLGVVVTYE